MNIIYGLIDPRTLLIRYIGKSVNGEARAKAHRYVYAHSKSTHCRNWVLELQCNGLEFTYVVLDCGDSKDTLGALEVWWIAFGRALGWPLTNITIGGDGLPGYAQSAETKAKISKANRGKKRSAEQRERIRNGALNRSPEALLRIGAASAARPNEMWQRIGEKRRGLPGTPHTTEFKQALSHRNNLRWTATHYCALLRGDAYLKLPSGG